MRTKSWLLACIVLMAGSLFYFFLPSDSSESSAELSELLRQEQVKKSRERTISVRPAIPELPEYPWISTREWNLPLNNPAIVPAADAYFLEPDDTVCGVLLGEHARAYPWFVLANYHAVNDHIGGTPVIVNLCEACNGGAAFLADVAGTTLDFRPFGLKNGTWYAIDFQTGSYWYPFVGKAFDGPLKGTKLERIRLYFSTWREWVRDHPNTTVVLSSDEVRNRPHGRISHMANDMTFNPELLQRLIVKPNPKRNLLEGHELVFGLIPTGNSPAKAYKLEQLQNAESLIQSRFGNVPLVLFLQNEFQISAYVRMIDDVELELKLDSKDPWLMSDQLGNQWDGWGRTVSGPNHPAELRVADGYLAKWYEWIENFPNTELAEGP